MDKTLKKAYEIIFGEEPEDLQDWEMARAIAKNFSVPALGQLCQKR